MRAFASAATTRFFSTPARTFRIASISRPPATSYAPMAPRRSLRARSEPQATAVRLPARRGPCGSAVTRGASFSSEASSSSSATPESEDEFKLSGSDVAASSADDLDDAEPEFKVPSASEESSDDNTADAPAGRRRAKRRKPDPTDGAAPAVESTVDQFTRAETTKLQSQLLAWYVANRRELPWRAPPRFRVDGPPVHPPAPPATQSSPGAPYAVWVSEVMSQQTRLSVVVDYWTRWMAAFPTVQALAAAPLDRVNELWSGLGYYRRAKFLHEAAGQLMLEFDGDLPQTVTDLLKVKGIGKYTAGAISSIAFNLSAPAVDGNVERVLARTRPGILPNRLPASTPGAKAKVYEELATGLLADIECAGDFNQALMELGATVCTPKNPSCGTCPIQGLCGSHDEALAARRLPSTHAELYPVKDVSRKTKSRDEVVLVCICMRKGPAADLTGTTAATEFLLLQRPASGLLAGLWEPPNVVLSAKEADKHATPAARARLMDAYLNSLLPQLTTQTPASTTTAHTPPPRKAAGTATHVFSHIRQTLHVESCLLTDPAPHAGAGTLAGAGAAAFRWLPEAAVGNSAVATQMRKALALASRGAATPRRARKLRKQ
jgi:A/G-specific adenine glycosylase